MLLLLLPLLLLSCPPLAKQESSKEVSPTAQCSNSSDAEHSGSTSANYSLLYNYLTGTGAHRFSDSVTFGFLAAYGSAPVELGALPLAVAAVNGDPALLPGRRLRYVAADIGAGARRRGAELSPLAIRCMTEMRDAGAVAFIGPDDQCAAEALVAAAWNLPMIAYKCADTRLSDKSVYPTFARTLPPSSKVSKSVVALLRAFRWTKFVLVAGSRPAWGEQVCAAIKALSKAHGLEVLGEFRFAAADYISTAPHLREMDTIAARTFEKTRVYVFVGEHIALVDFVHCLQRRGLLRRGDYAVVSVDDEIYDPSSKLSVVSRAYLDPYLHEDAYNAFKDITAFRSVLKLTPSHPQNPKYEELCEEIRNLSAQPPFCVPYHRTVFDTISVPAAAAHLYDAVLLYARALTEALQAGDDPRNGTAVMRRVRNTAYHSLRGYDVVVDANGDAEGNFTVLALQEDAAAAAGLSMQPVGAFWYPPARPLDPLHLPEFRYLNASRPIQWVAGRPPPAEPPCGFRGELCGGRGGGRGPLDWRAAVAAGAVAAALAAGAVLALRHWRYEQRLACLLWRVDLRDVTFLPVDPQGGCGGGSVVGAEAGSAEAGGRRAHTTIGLYRGSIVAVKHIHKRSVDLTRSIRKELKQVREARHENLLQFIGASVEHGAVALLSAYCARGSLRDVLSNADLRLDAAFVSSLVADLLKGLIYIHESELVSHGNLHSGNCLVDSRWVLQIADFGLHEFKAGQEDPQEEAKERQRRLYRAPELLRRPVPVGRGTQKGDVYAFAIVLFELIGRQGPWGRSPLSEDEIAARVAAGAAAGAAPLRPDVGALPMPESVRRCMESCWAEDPDARPDVHLVRLRLKEMQTGLKPNIFDNMLAMMEKYASNLEGLVQERTNQLMEEKKKTDALLHRMLPKTVAEALKRGEPVPAESFDCVTILFSDIVGFTELSAVSTPWQVVDMLNDLYTCCDSILSHYDVYKVETIGDAYMVVSGLPLRNGDRHAGEVASLALHLLARMRRFTIRHRPGEPLRLRIGVHSGHCVAGVVGLKMPRYCLFGDTVNTASRMESAGAPCRIHVSASTQALLHSLGGYICERRGLVHIKGKGEMLTYWLIGEDESRRRIREDGSPVLDLSGRETPDLLRREPTPSPRSSLLRANAAVLRANPSLLRPAAAAAAARAGEGPTRSSAGALLCPAAPSTSSPPPPLLPWLLRAAPAATPCHRSAPTITFCDPVPAPDYHSR